MRQLCASCMFQMHKKKILMIHHYNSMFMFSYVLHAQSNRMQEITVSTVCSEWLIKIWLNSIFIRVPRIWRQFLGGIRFSSCYELWIFIEFFHIDFAVWCWNTWPVCKWIRYQYWNIELSSSLESDSGMINRWGEMSHFAIEKNTRMRRAEHIIWYNKKRKRKKTGQYWARQKGCNITRNTSNIYIII